MTDALALHAFREPVASCPKCGSLVPLSRRERHEARDAAIGRLVAIFDDDALERLGQLIDGETHELAGDLDGVPLVEWEASVLDEAEAEGEAEAEEEADDAGPFDVFDELPADEPGARGYPRR